MSGDDWTANDPDLVDAVRSVHKAFPTGVMIVTTIVDDTPYGLAVNAFSSVSLQPPALLVCVAATSSTYRYLIAGDDVVVNALAHDQRGLASRFAQSRGDKFDGVRWQAASNGAPILDGVAGYFEMTIERRIPAYTHTIFLGRVGAAWVSGLAPLIYLGGDFYDGSSLSQAD